MSSKVVCALDGMLDRKTGASEYDQVAYHVQHVFFPIKLSRSAVERD